MKEVIGDSLLGLHELKFVLIVTVMEYKFAK